MIEKMKVVYIVTSVSKKQELLKDVRNLGIVHLAEKKGADRDITERFASLSRIELMLKDFVADKKAKGQVLPDNEFETMYQDILVNVDRKNALLQEKSSAVAELERIRSWGEFSPEEVKALADEGFDFHFYSLGKKELETALKDENVRLIRLASVDKMDTVAVLGAMPATIPATEFKLPEKGIADLEKQIGACDAGIGECDAVFKKAAAFLPSFQDQMIKTQNAEEFSSVDHTVENDDAFVWMSGYIPEADLDAFKAMAAEKQWAWAVDDPAADDEKIPTKVKYNKVTRLMKPVFDILGTLPGYQEFDIALPFLLFFTLFFAMIIGDAGYGCIFLVGSIGYIVKTKKKNDAVLLLMVLSIATIVWGAITGTWFGMQSAMNIPFLKALVVPSFANYPEFFGVSTTAQQNMIMKFSFSIGAIQICLACILSIRRKLSQKDLSWIADLGWFIDVIALYFLVLYLVIGQSINFTPVVAAVAAGFALVVLFGGMAPDKTFAQGLKAGLADAFTVFLNTISCFGNVMSYIRLFAVGMASLAIAQSFNNMAAGFKGPLIVVGAIIVIIGHLLNIVMGFLSVVVHGVRLNLLEFSGQLGMEWTGIAYAPFKKNDKIKK